MKKTIKNIFKYTLIASLLLFILGAGAFSVIYFAGDKVRFDEAKFYQSVSKIDFFDSENMLIEENNSYNVEFIKLSSLQSYTPDAFISIEDKGFYTHKGLDYKRIAKAFLLDLKNRNMAQGASTISQQLIKNTHLSSQKTFSRKINEIVLAKELESKLSKEQILENYLNIIYFGDNCYGIEKASLHYFSKSAKDLFLHESALLAGIISSPAYYSPITKPENALRRRNLVLGEMLKDGKITTDEFETAKNKELELNVSKNDNNTLNSYTEASLDEAMEILRLPAKQISLGEYKIYTYYNKEKQQNLLNTLENTDFSNNNYSAISINAQNGQIEAFSGNGNYKTLQINRQPASVIKPILIYAPAINENIIAPITQILDEEISILGYKPQNHDLQYHGYLSVRDAVSKSYNIPAVKVMSYLGIDKAKKYAVKTGIEFDEKDNNYAISLGGMTYGTNLKTMTGAYTSLSNNGNFVKPKFISYITDKNDNLIYIADKTQTPVFREDTAYLMNEILISACSNGTSKGLAGLPFQVASKTGTIGKMQTNYDAWAISYTTQDILGVWIGNFDNSPIGNIVGGTVPIHITKQYFEKIYSGTRPENFTKPSGVVEVDIDLRELKENHQIVLANDFLPDEFKKAEVFSLSNMPKISEEHSLLIKNHLEGKVENGYAILTFDAIKFAGYDLKQNDNVIQTFTNENGKVTYKVLLQDNKVNRFTLVTKLKNYKTEEEIVEESNTVELLKTPLTGENLERIRTKWYL